MREPLLLGPYVVREGLRPDNPAFPVYLIFKGDELIGKSFSMPDEGCCRWIEQQAEYERTVYAEPAKKEDTSIYLRGVTGRKRRALKPYTRPGRPSNAERARRSAELLQIPKDE